MQGLVRVLLIHILMNYKIHLKNYVIIVTCFFLVWQFESTLFQKENVYSYTATPENNDIIVVIVGCF